jgi:hypothetical protein
MDTYRSTSIITSSKLDKSIATWFKTRLMNYSISYRPDIIYVSFE